ncbi:ABC transporter permease [Micromonospora aurantiaca]|uniref:ABC transporter permease n=1 Tax=Micromonospora TaxID=1873 RepID=UPI00296FAD22|nr:ABC transporter permease [Micromonospora sp. BRA006-A]MDW3848622.1 ABC transporter permease [Micromonospora sp. BRA006-A]MEE3921360.1 ABC transporter permease [Micromonospora sp. BRA006-A]
MSVTTETPAGVPAEQPSAVLEDVLRRSLTAYPRPPRPGPLAASLTHLWRALATFRHHPAQLVDMILFPFIFLLVFTHLFGGAIGGSTSDYLQLFLPGILVQTVVMMSVYTGTALNTDITKGIFDRFRTLPFWQPATIVGSLLADMFRYVVALTLTITLGVLLGFRGSLTGTIFAVLVLILFAFGVSWIFTTLGVVAKAPETVASTSMIVVFPLVFTSNIFVPTETMPRWMQIIADANPMSFAATAARGLMHGDATVEQIAWVVGISVGLVLVFGPLTMAAYHRRKGR